MKLQHVGLHDRNDLVQCRIIGINRDRHDLGLAGNRFPQETCFSRFEMARAFCEENEADMACAFLDRRGDGLLALQSANLDVECHGQWSSHETLMV